MAARNFIISKKQSFCLLLNGPTNLFSPARRWDIDTLWEREIDGVGGCGRGWQVWGDFGGRFWGEMCWKPSHCSKPCYDESEYRFIFCLCLWLNFGAVFSRKGSILKKAHPNLSISTATTDPQPDTPSLFHSPSEPSSPALPATSSATVCQFCGQPATRIARVLDEQGRIVVLQVCTDCYWPESDNG